jgi:hypothetical protein
MATLIELGSIRSLPRFEWYTQRVHRQLGRTPGLIGYSFRGEFPLRYWTLSAWEDGRALNGFVKAGKHRTVMTSRAEHAGFRATTEGDRRSAVPELGRRLNASPRNTGGVATDRARSA